MGKFAMTIFLATGIGGVLLGFYLIYSVVMRKEWLDKDFFRIPMSFGSKFLNRIQYVWIGIVLIIFFAGLTYSIIQERF
jgi:4-hydroxybenzoate polyprenyltransferase